MSSIFATLGLMHKGLGAVSAFASPSGTMGFMMSSVLQNQTLIINELINIHVSLAEIKSEIRAIRDQVSNIVQDQFRDELVSSIAADVETYSSWLKASAVDQSIFVNEEVREQMRLMLARLQNTIGTLVNSPEGRGPHAGFAIPLSASLEIALQNRLKFPDQVLLSSIDKYLNWTDGVLSKEDGSIFSNMSSEIDHHNQAICALPDNNFFERLAFRNLLIGDGGGKLGFAEHCIVYGKFSGHEKFPLLPFRKLRIGMLAGGFTSIETYSIKLYDSPEHAALLSELTRGPRVIEKFPLENPSFNLGPDMEDPCFAWSWEIEEAATYEDLEKYDDEVRTKEALGRYLRLQTDQAYTTLASINLIRSKISLAYKATMVVESAQTELKNSRSFLA